MSRLRQYDLADQHEKAIYEALVPISASLVGKQGFASQEARERLEVSLAYCGMLIAIATEADEDDDRYGQSGCDVRDDIEMEASYREDHRMKELECTDDSSSLRDTLEAEMVAAISAIQGAPKHYKVAV